MNLGSDWLITRWVDQQRGGKKSKHRHRLCYSVLAFWLRSSLKAHGRHSPLRFPSSAMTMTVAMVMLCTMMVHANVKPQKDFNLQRFAGKWYRVGLAYDAPSFVPYRSQVKASVGIVTPLPSGNVNLTMWEATPFGCQSKKYQYERTSVPGQFTYFSTRHNMVKDITVVETNYTDYAVVLKHKVFNREYTQVALYGRALSVRPEVIQKFKAFVLSRGLPKESVVIPPPAENCAPSRSRR